MRMHSRHSRGTPSMAFGWCDTRLRLRKSATGGLVGSFRDFNREQPVSDEIFRAYQGLYAYDKTPLNAVLESGDDSSASWRKEKVSFDAAYGKERVTAYLFLPKNSSPPFQTLVYFPGSYAIYMRSSPDLKCNWLTFYRAPEGP